MANSLYLHFGFMLHTLQSAELFRMWSCYYTRSPFKYAVKTLREFMVEESKGYSSDEDQVLRRTDNLVPEMMEMEKDVFCKEAGKAEKSICGYVFCEQ